MKNFGGPALLLDRSDINTDEIIPAKYLTEITKEALKPHLLEDLLLDGKPFDSKGEPLKKANVVVARENFGCGSSREHAVWAFEVNDINIVIAQSFARIFRQNMFNCGILAIELPGKELEQLFAMGPGSDISVDLEKMTVTATAESGDSFSCGFELNGFDRDLVSAGGWLEFADQRY